MPATKKKDSKAFRHAKHVSWRKVADEAIILDVDTAVYYSMNKVGLRVWELLGRKTPTAKIVSALTEEFDAPAERIAKDVERLIAQLRKEEVIEPA